MTLAKEITVTLETPIAYHHNGGEAEGTFVSLQPPTSRNLVECAMLKQAMYQAAVSIGKGQEAGDAPPEEEQSLSGKELMQMLYIAESVDISTILLTGKDLLKTAALLEGEQKMTVPLLDKLSLSDLENLIGEYIAAFIFASM